MVPQASAPAFIYRYVLACTDNADVGGATDAGCGLSSTSCPPDQLRHWLYRSPADAVLPRWDQFGSRCLTRVEADAAGVEFPGFTLADLQRLPLPAGEPALEPGNGYVLINVPANVYADAEPVELATDVVGFPVQVRATPARYSWAFGDGAVLGPTEDPGAPYPDLRVTHIYTAPGRYDVVLTTHYSGEYSVAGGPWLPVEGEAEVVSPPVPVEALAARSALVSGAAPS
ncbi:PKD domain-containing protein [Quadrisphaera sp. DSM 44207]|nr:PKD domain-containing protein [Quadrisphaera sp. DSM 44207]